MSEENVEMVRRCYTVLDDVLARYWAAPDMRFSESPLVEEVLPLLHPDAEWDALHWEKPYRGSEEALLGVETGSRRARSGGCRARN